MGSAGFLLVYAAVSIGHMRIREQTGAKAWPVVASAAHVPFPVRGPLLPHDHHRADISYRSRRHAGGELPVRELYRRTTGRTFKEILTRPTLPLRPQPQGLMSQNAEVGDQRREQLGEGPSSL